MEITYHQEIIAPIEIVFDFLNDDEKKKLWMEGLESTEYPKGKNEGNPVGSIFVQTIGERGNSQEFAGIVTEFAPPTLLAVQLQGSAFRADVTYELTDRGRKTDLDYHCDLVFNSLLFRIVGFLFRGLTSRILKNQMTKLKELSEQAAVRRSPPQV